MSATLRAARQAHLSRSCMAARSTPDAPRRASCTVGPVRAGSGRGPCRRTAARPLRRVNVELNEPSEVHPTAMHTSVTDTWPPRTLVSPVPRVWPASSRTVYRRTPRGTGGRTVTATSAQRVPSPGRLVAARTRDPASSGPGADAPGQRPPYEDRTPCSVTTAASSPTSAPGSRDRRVAGEQFGRPAGERRGGNVAPIIVRGEPAPGPAVTGAVDRFRQAEISCRNLPSTRLTITPGASLFGSSPNHRSRSRAIASLTGAPWSSPTRQWTGCGNCSCSSRAVTPTCTGCFITPPDDAGQISVLRSGTKMASLPRAGMARSRWACGLSTAAASSRIPAASRM